MIKRILGVVILMILTLNLTGCNNTIANNKILEDELLVYTTYSDDVMKYITEEFKSETGVTIDYKTINYDIEENLKNSNPDILLGVDVEINNKLKEKGKLCTCETSWFNDVSAVNKGDDGTWYSTTKEPIVLFYNSKYMPTNMAPKSWLDLANKNYKDKILMEHINEQYVKNMISTIMYQFEKDNKASEGLLFLQGLKNNIYKSLNNSEELFNDIQNKETPIGISKLSDFIKAKNNNIQLVEVNSPQGSIFSTESVSILKNAQHRNIAKLFVEFIAGPRIQLNLANKFNLIPTSSEALKYSPEWMQKLLDKSMPIDYKIINENRNKWIEEFNKFEKEQASTINLNKNIK